MSRLTPMEKARVEIIADQAYGAGHRPGEHDPVEDVRWLLRLVAKLTVVEAGVR